MSLNTFLYQIQIMLFAGSSMLLVGSIIGLYLKGRILSEEPLFLFSSNNEISETKEDPYCEKRHARRVPSFTLLELMNPAGEFIPNSARMHDISVKGARFDSSIMMKQGKRIQARLHSSKEGLLRISARIVWLQPKNNRIVYGVEFDTVNPADS